MQTRDLLKLQNDISRKEMLVDNLLFVIRSSSITIQEKAALKKAINEIEKSIKQLRTALDNNI